MNPHASVQADLRDWNPSLYMRFEDERTLAARDLLARVPIASPGVVYDLGCGPGNSAELLTRRYPDAAITGIDRSQAMLEHAQARVPGARFVRQDIAAWTPPERPHLIFANGALHFLPDHHELFPRLAATLAPGGVFAAQMPSTARELSHALMRMVAAEGPWWPRLASVAKTQPLIAAFEFYYEWLRPVASRIDMYLALGCLMDAMAMIILTVPIVFPVVTALGFDPIWFGIIIVMTVELGLIHPPVGMNVFVIKTAVQDVSFTTIFKGVLPFIATDMIRLVILIGFPQIALYLPNLT